MEFDTTGSSCEILFGFTDDSRKAELCADELVVGGGVGWSYDRRRRRAAHFSSAASAASNPMREH